MLQTFPEESCSWPFTAFNLIDSLSVYCFSLCFLLCCLCMCWVAQSCPTLSNATDWSPPGSCIHGIFQARILEWVATSYSRGSSQPRDWSHVSYISCIDYSPLWHLGSPKLIIGLCFCIRWEPIDYCVIPGNIYILNRDIMSTLK